MRAFASFYLFIICMFSYSVFLVYRLVLCEGASHLRLAVGLCMQGCGLVRTASLRVCSYVFFSCNLPAGCRRHFCPYVPCAVLKHLQRGSGVLGTSVPHTEVLSQN